jgi:hypothetical protein
VAAFRAQYGLGAEVAVLGGYGGGLADGGEPVTLKTSGGGTDIVSFQYGDGRGWPVAADGAGHSLVPLDRALPGQATGSLDYPGNWRPSTFIGGSPGRADPAPPADDVVLNEIAAHTDFLTTLDSNDWIEFYNRSATDFEFGPDWYLSDDPAVLRKWAVPSTARVPAGGRVTFDEVSGFHFPTNVGFGLSKSGDRVVFSHLPGTGADRVVDAVQFEGQENDYSWERYPDGAAWWYPAARSSNAVNRLPAPAVVIREMMYHPPSSDGTNDNTLDEYIQIWNPTGASTNLYNTNGAWRLSGGVSFTLPAGTTVPPAGHLLVVNFDPAVGTNLARFRDAYGVGPGVTVVGPYGGKLGNRSDRVSLEKPQYPDWPGDPYSWVVVDEVIYGNQDPWPPGPNGGGTALQRVDAARSGLDPSNWVAVAPNPGGSTVNLDRDGDGLPNDWETRYGLDPDQAGDAALDSDGDRLTNLEEYLAGTDPRDPSSVLRFESVTSVGTLATLTFRAAAGKAYTLQFRDSFPGQGWQELRQVPAEGVARLVEVQDDIPPDVPERYYRLVLPASP